MMVACLLFLPFMAKAVSPHFVNDPIGNNQLAPLKLRLDAKRHLFLCYKEVVKSILGVHASKRQGISIRLLVKGPHPTLHSSLS